MGLVFFLFAILICLVLPVWLFDRAINLWYALRGKKPMSSKEWLKYMKGH